MIQALSLVRPHPSQHLFDMGDRGFRQDAVAEIEDQPAARVIFQHIVDGAVERATQRISACLAAPEVAAALDIKSGSPLIELVRIVYDRDGHGVEHLHALYRPDRYGFEFDLVRSGAAAKRSWEALPQRLRKPKAGGKKKSSGDLFT